MENEKGVRVWRGMILWWYGDGCRVNGTCVDISVWGEDGKLLLMLWDGGWG